MNTMQSTIKSAVFCLSFLAYLSMSAPIEWISTTQNAPWVDKGTTQTVATDNSTKNVTVNQSQVYQEIQGWGGCFNEKGYKALAKVPTKLMKVMSMLFSPDSGCGFTICRMPMGASDFAVNAYTLDDIPANVANDYSMSYFSFTRDSTNLLRYIKWAKTFSPNLKVWASPWTCPPWMKKNARYYGGDTLRTDSLTLTAYALYMEKFVQAYRAAGVDLYAIHVQNEPDNNTYDYSGHFEGYPSCIVTPTMMRDFIKKYLGPRFAANNIPAQIWIGTIRDANYQYEPTIMGDAGARQYVAGIGYQYDGGQSVGRFHTDYPTLPIFETENFCRYHTNSWADGWDDFGGPGAPYGGMVTWLRDGVNAFMQWNMILDQSGVNTKGWQQNSMITIDTTALTVTYNTQYYAVRHLSQYVRPGAHRIGVTTDSDLDAVAFKNFDSSIVVALRNKNTTATRSFKLQFGTQMATVQILGSSLNTFIFNKPTTSAKHQPGIQRDNKTSSTKTIKSMAMSIHQLNSLMREGKKVSLYNVHGKEIAKDLSGFSKSFTSLSQNQVMILKTVY